MHLAAEIDGAYRISSFFDVFMEISTDAGSSWQAATSGPARTVIQDVTTERPFPSPDILPEHGQYGNTNDSVGFANGFILRDMTLRDLDASWSLPLPGTNASHSCAGTVDMLFLQSGGGGFTSVTAFADVTFSVGPFDHSGSTRYFETEMTALDISGGDLPSGVQIRENPAYTSPGRHSVRTGENVHRADSFFDVYFQLSTDGGQTWLPATNRPLTLMLEVADPWIWMEKAGTNGLRLFWPDPPEGYVLQQSTNLLFTSLWQTVTLPLPTFTNGERFVAMEMTNDVTFFRVARP
jgi:hypothetical protein